MKLNNVTDTMTKNKWNSLIQDYKLKTVYHMWEWLEFIQESQNLKKYIYEIILDNKVVGYLPGFLIKKGPLRIFGSPFPGWTTPYMGPLLDNNVSQAFFYKEFKNLMKQEKYHYAEITNINLDGEAAKKEDLVVTERITYLAELAPSSEEILARFRKSTKFAVRKIIRENTLDIEITNDESFLDYYYSQMEVIFAKSNKQPTYSKERIRLLIEKMAPTGKLLLTWAKYEEKPIACMIDLIDGQWMYSFGASSDQNYLNIRPNGAIRFFVMNHALEQGVKYYDFMGADDYKSQFGSEKFITYRIIYSQWESLFKLRNFARKLLNYKNIISFKLRGK
jgi:lipid II:glycine glycyltransferase (peptidoglycan interpeptide bridge formation enzyme)